MSENEIAAFVLGVPLAIMCGGVIMHMMVIIGLIALAGYHPGLAAILLVGWVFLRLAPAFFGGFAVGLGIGAGERRRRPYNERSIRQGIEDGQRR